MQHYAASMIASIFCSNYAINTLKTSEKVNKQKEWEICKGSDAAAAEVVAATAQSIHLGRVLNWFKEFFFSFSFLFLKAAKQTQMVRNVYNANRLARNERRSLACKLRCCCFIFRKKEECKARRNSWKPTYQAVIFNLPKVGEKMLNKFFVYNNCLQFPFKHVLLCTRRLTKWSFISFYYLFVQRNAGFYGCMLPVTLVAK